MKITDENIEKYLFGALRVWKEEDWLCFSRFTQRQAQILEERNFSLHKRATAGMRLEFMTHGGEIFFDYEMGKANGGPNSYCGLEITQNGMPVYHIFERVLFATGEVRFEVKQTNKPVHISIYFPNLAYLKLKNVQIPDDSGIVKKNKKLLALGDSITQGAVSQHAHHTYVNILADQLEVDVLNQGIGGERFCGNFLEKLSFEPDFITVGYGVNDYQTGTICSGEIEKYFEKLTSLYPKTPVFVLLPIWWQQENVERNGHTLEDYRVHIKKVAKQYPNVTIFESGSFLPPINEFYWDDVHLHPNDLGFLYYGPLISKKLKDTFICKNMDRCFENRHEEN